MKNNRLFLITGVIAAVILLFFLLKPDKAKEGVSLTKSVEQGPFNISVVATGELEAKKSKKIMAPKSMRMAQINESTIQNMVAEGTEVKKGDFVAQLDKTDIGNRMADIQTEMDKINTQLDQAKIDTSIEMRNLRDQLNNIKFSMEETKLQVELNRYEPQAVIRQKNIEYEKIIRNYDQVYVKLGLTKEKNNAKIAEIKATLKQQQQKMQRLIDLSKEFTIMAPADGMVIYHRSWDGKVKTGSRVRSWNPVVAELPDLSEMISKTYVNEVDISKVSIGQDAIIKVDAFPGKEYKGIVTQVANIGEKLRDYDTKVFEVLVSVLENDSILRPAMTTSIEILVNNFDEVNYIPIESLFKDSIEYVYLKRKGEVVKKEVAKGPSNETNIVVLAGLEPNDVVLLNEPPNKEKITFEYIDKALKESRIAAFEKEKEKVQQELIEKKKRVKNDIEREGEESQVFYIF